VLREEREYEDRLENIKKELKIGKYRKAIEVKNFAIKVQELPRGESSEEVVEDKPYENLSVLPTYINEPLKRMDTSTLTEQSVNTNQYFSVTEELSKPESIYLNRIKTNIAKKTSSEFNIRKNMSVPRMLTRMRTTKR